MPDVLVDTSAWIEALRRRGRVAPRESVRAVLTEGRAVTCDLVLLELWNGASGTEETRLLADLQRELHCLPIDQPVWAASQDLARRCRSAGVTVPSTDLVVAACAQRHGVGLLHFDRHFDAIERARTRDPV